MHLSNTKAVIEEMLLLLYLRIFISCVTIAIILLTLVGSYTLTKVKNVYFNIIYNLLVSILKKTFITSLVISLDVDNN